MKSKSRHIKEKGIFEPLARVFLTQLGEGLVSLVLFGSQARGEGRARSDWDILLLADALPPHPFERQVFLRKILPKKLPFQVSLLAKTVEEFERDFPAVYLDIATDGVILFDRDNYAQKKLHRIREIIQEAGLKRSRKDGALVWEWKEQPQVGWCIDWRGIYGLQRRGKLQTQP